MKYQGFIWTGVMVENLETSITFYRDVLGLPLLGKGDDWAHLDASNGALLELISGGRASQEPKTPDQQSIILGLRVDDLDGVVEELKQKGVHFIDEIGEFEGTRWVRFSDPEGNQFEIKEIP